ncbi:HNH endonuclease [Ceratobasidium theobromae]|uniref:HNH endonuclease n=1 Tax=Ceratobasidium theobromae TaxID=1582974 RepID=A0A5N5Q8I0_9AGAM|nr:HNH endonuclease [Ceratobasidium theobromae]
MPKAPLPSPESVFPDDPEVRNAYQRVYSLQDQQPLRMAILGWMLIHAPSNQGRTQVAQDINAATNDEEVFKLGNYLQSFFFNHFKFLAKKRTTTPSTHRSRPELEAVRQEILNGLVSVPTSHNKAKEQALIRDNYRCMLSGTIDSRSLQTTPALRTEILSNPLLNAGPTQCCHILPQYITQHLTMGESKQIPPAVALVLRQFGGVMPDELRGEGMHHLRNIMTLENGIHISFDDLLIWLEPVEGEEHQYEFRRELPIHQNVPDVLNFTTMHEGLSFPDRQYLALHAACAKVVHMSGAAELIDKLLEEMEDTKILSEDGSSSQLLEFLLPNESVMVS